MKLLFCFNCQDVVKLRTSITKCRCGETYGRYLDDVNAEYGGGGCLLGIANRSLGIAIARFTTDQGNHMFDAFTIPDNSPNIRRIRNARD